MAHCDYNFTEQFRAFTTLLLRGLRFCSVPLRCIVKEARGKKVCLPMT